MKTSASTSRWLFPRETTFPRLSDPKHFFVFVAREKKWKKERNREREREMGRCHRKVPSLTMIIKETRSYSYHPLHILFESLGSNFPWPLCMRLDVLLSKIIPPLLVAMMIFMLIVIVYPYFFFFRHLFFHFFNSFRSKETKKKKERKNNFFSLI